MKYKVIDNFLDEEYFNSLVTLFTDKDTTGFILPWYLCQNVTFSENSGKGDQPLSKLFYMIHLIYNENVQTSNHYPQLVPLVEKLGIKCLLRIKANLYPNTEILHEHQFHTDYDYLQSAAILSLNTCDGYTKFKDGTKINSVANRMLIFDGVEEHCSTTTTNVFARINININYIQEQSHEPII